MTCDIQRLRKELGLRDDGQHLGPLVAYSNHRVCSDCYAAIQRTLEIYFKSE